MAKPKHTMGQTKSLCQKDQFIEVGIRLANEINGCKQELKDLKNSIKSLQFTLKSQNPYH